MITLVFVGGAVGAVLRYLADVGFRRAGLQGFPFGILAANGVASFALAILAVGVILQAVPGTMMTFLGTGLCGALSTYSTLSYDTLDLFRRRQRVKALVNVVVSTVAGLLCAAFGVGFAIMVWARLEPDLEWRYCVRLRHMRF